MINGLLIIQLVTGLVFAENGYSSDSISQRQDQVEMQATKSSSTSYRPNSKYSHLVKIGEYTTSFSQNDTGRLNNMKLASKKINGTVLQPKEQFSFNRTVGERSSSLGWSESTVIVNKHYVKGIGGGICQISSTLFNAVDNSNLQVVERHPHSLPVSYVPTGRDATVAYGSLDFKFKNNLNQPISIFIIVSGTKVTATIYKVVN